MNRPPDHAPPPIKPSDGKPWESAKDAGSAADPLAARFVESLSYDTRLYRHDIAGSLAHARMLASAQLITADDLAAIERGLTQIESEIEQQGAAWPGWRIELEDVHMCIEAALIEKIGDPGRKLHTGRSRNDQVALDLRLWTADAADEIQASFDRLCRAFLALADSDGRIVMPGYTHLQRAQPILVGGELLAWIEAFGRCADRLATLMLFDTENPLGSGAIAGSSLPLDRQHTTDALGVFTEPTGNSLDATASRDVAIDFLYALAMTAQWLSRFAEQWILYASTEFGFITLDERYTTGSSMMPQKRNPDMLELIRGRCGNVYGHLIALLTICKGLTLGYNRDLQEDKRHLFAAYDTVRDSLEMAARIVATTRFNADCIREGLDRGFLDATSLAEYLVTRGVPFRTSHQIVGRLVRLCQQRQRPRLADLSLADFKAACEAAGVGADVCANDVFDWLGPQNVVQRYQSSGNAGVSGFERQLEMWRAALTPEGESTADA